MPKLSAKKKTATAPLQNTLAYEQNKALVSQHNKEHTSFSYEGVQSDTCKASCLEKFRNSKTQNLTSNAGILYQPRQQLRTAFIPGESELSVTGLACAFALADLENRVPCYEYHGQYKRRGHELDDKLDGLKAFVYLDLDATPLKHSIPGCVREVVDRLKERQEKIACTEKIQLHSKTDKLIIIDLDDIRTLFKGVKDPDFCKQYIPEKYLNGRKVKDVLSNYTYEGGYFQDGHCEEQAVQNPPASFATVVANFYYDNREYEHKQDCDLVIFPSDDVVLLLLAAIWIDTLKKDENSNFQVLMSDNTTETDKELEKWLREECFYKSEHPDVYAFKERFLREMNLQEN